MLIFFLLKLVFIWQIKINFIFLSYKYYFLNEYELYMLIISIVF